MDLNKQNIIDSINNSAWDALLCYLEDDSWRNIGVGDMLVLLEQYTIIDCVIMALKYSNYDSFLYHNEGSLFPEVLTEEVSREIRDSVLEIIERNESEQVGYLIGLDLIRFLEDEDIFSLLSKPSINVLKLYLSFFVYNTKCRDFSLKDQNYPSLFFRKCNEVDPESFKSKLADILCYGDIDLIVVLFDFYLIDYFTKVEILSFIQDHQGLLDRLLLALNKVDGFEEKDYEKYSWLIPKQFFE